MANRMKINSPEEMQVKIDAYFEECKGTILTDNDGQTIFNKFGEPVMVDVKPLTITGLALALGFNSRQTLLNYQGRGAYKSIIETAKLRIENYAEMRLYDKDGMNGARFNLQNNFQHWDADKAAQDDKKAPAINIICDIPRTAVTSSDEQESIDPLTVSGAIKELERKTGGESHE